MPQSYKIFINENPVFLIAGSIPVNANLNDSAHPILNFNQEKEVEKAFHLLENHAGIKSLTIYGDNAKEMRNTLFAGYKKIAAAGGLVFNNKGQVLLIYRRNSWDLPKGKIDAGEKKKAAALRAVREETGLEKLSIIRKLKKTYHTYLLENNTPVLKVTHWYLMMCNDVTPPVPQTEEDIELATWIDIDEVELKFNKTYANIQDVIHSGVTMMHYG